MPTGMKCRKCGAEIDPFSRFCPRCGNQVYVSLDQDPKPEIFIDLFLSLYNLLADITNERRGHYLANTSEKIMRRRCRLEFDDETKRFTLDFLTRGGLPDAVLDLYNMAISNCLNGYTYRVVEEMVTKTKSPKLSDAEIHYLMTSMHQEAGDELKQSCYRELSPKDALDHRVLFCLALSWDNRHLGYMLADDTHQKEWYGSLLSDCVQDSMRINEGAFRVLVPKANIRAIMERKESVITDSVVEDFKFGYIVRLSESLFPYS